MKIYHISFKEKYMPHKQDFGRTNALMEKLGVPVSTNYRKGSPQFGISYIVLFMQDGKPFFSRVDARHYDAFEIFNNGHEVRECSSYQEFERAVKEFAINGYVESENYEQTN